MPAQALQVFSTVTNFLIIIFVGYYFLRLRNKEKTLEKNETQIDTQYHQIVNDALVKERKILDDATAQADYIITNAKNLSNSSQESIHQALQKMVNDVQKETTNVSTNFTRMSNSSEQIIGQLLQKMVADTQKDALTTTQHFMNSYSTSLKQVAIQSLTDFQSITKGFSSELEKEIKLYKETAITSLHKELEEYKQARLRQAEQSVMQIVQKASQNILHTSINLNDQQNLVIEALEKAKKEGVLE